MIVPAVMSGQVAVGGWTLYSSFTGVDEICETDVYTYYRSSTSLFRIDKETGETATLNISNYLNDSGVTNIFSDPLGKSIIVVYESTNMDRIYDDGRIVNMADIKNATITSSKTINDIAFGKEKFYVATDFGLVTYDNKKNEVRETMYTSNIVKVVFTFEDYMGISVGNQLMFGNQEDKLTKLEQLRFVGDYTIKMSWRKIKSSGGRYLLLTRASGNSHFLHKFEVKMEENKIYGWVISVPNSTGESILVDEQEIGVNKDEIYAYSNNYVVKMDKDGNVSYDAIPETLQQQKLSYHYDGNSVWAGNKEGINSYELTSDGGLTELTGKMRGSDLSIPRIHAMHIGKSGKIYMYNTFEHIVFDVSEPSPKQSMVCVLEDGTFTDVSGVDVEKQSKSGESTVSPYFVNKSYHLYEDPDNKDSYYIGTMHEGAYRIENGKQTHKYYTTNSPLQTQYNAWACNVIQPIVDKHGNLWLYAFANEKDAETVPRFFVLQAEHRMDANPPASAWKEHIVKGYDKDQRDAFGICCEKTNHLVFTPGRYSNYIIVFDTKGTASVNDDTSQLASTYVNQDGKVLSFVHITALAEDARGRIWVGTNNGVFEITDLSKVNSATITVNQLKVPRNDGTNLADYLLSTELVTDIAVDSSNRKWISTKGSGVYLVSENGDEILSHYTMNNSLLPSNTVYAVECEPNSNKVYFGTEFGLVEYSSTSSPGKADYGDVYAYPNPVRPDYTGLITVTGLMEDSLVKIADANGNVFHQGRSNGGMFTWDGCNASGERVKTGVYYVFASQNADGSSSACVTKIMVVN